MNINPAHSKWVNRDRFVLSNGMYFGSAVRRIKTEACASILFHEQPN